MQLFQSLKFLSVSLEGDLCPNEALLPKELVSVLLFPSSSLLSLRGASLAFPVSGVPPSHHGD